MAKSKFFRVAVEGATTDGRNIERSWLTEIEQTYNRAKYGARMFIEHIRGYNPEYGFRAQGDVLAVKTEKVTIDGQERLALYAQIQPTDEFVAMTKAGQKIYSSIEVNPDFMGSGKAYLMGLGVTDSPASLGTEVLTFASQHPDASPFKSRKQQPGNLFSAAELAEIEFEDEPSDVPASTLFKTVREALAKLAGKEKTNDTHFAEVRESLEEVVGVMQQFADSQAAVTKQFNDSVTALVARVDAIEAAVGKSSTEFSALKTQLESEAVGLPRPPATGGGDEQLADC